MRGTVLLARIERRNEAGYTKEQEDAQWLKQTRNQTQTVEREKGQIKRHRRETTPIASQREGVIEKYRRIFV